MKLKLIHPARASERARKNSCFLLRAPPSTWAEGTGQTDRLKDPFPDWQRLFNLFIPEIVPRMPIYLMIIPLAQYSYCCCCPPSTCSALGFSAASVIWGLSADRLVLLLLRYVAAIRLLTRLSALAFPFFPFLLWDYFWNCLFFRLRNVQSVLRTLNVQKRRFNFFLETKFPNISKRNFLTWLNTYFSLEQHHEWQSSSIIRTISFLSTAEYRV